MKVLVAGAGIVGLAVARAAALAGHEVVVAERAPAIGTGISSRNSEVIHGGMYYPAGSLRAVHCVAGRRMLYEFCRSHKVRHLKCGKLVVAVEPSQLVAIEKLAEQGRKNGTENLLLIDGDEARRMEPALSCIAALRSPETGIVDAHGLMVSLQGDLEDAGGCIAFETPVERVERRKNGWLVRFGGAESSSFDFDAFVNCAGLHAQSLASRCESYPPERIPELVMVKGNYFAYAGKPAFKRLIYPVPVEGGLGVHVTIDLSGRMRFGPDVEWIPHEDYQVDPARSERFYENVKSFWPEVKRELLFPDYSGIRPKLSGPGEPAADFVIDGPGEHGLPGIVHFFGIESPGLTSALSLGDAAARLL